MSKPQRYGPSENWDSYLASMRESDSGDYYHRDDIDPILERVKVLEEVKRKAEQVLSNMGDNQHAYHHQLSRDLGLDSLQATLAKLDATDFPQAPQ